MSHLCDESGDFQSWECLKANGLQEIVVNGFSPEVGHPMKTWAGGCGLIGKRMMSMTRNIRGWKTQAAARAASVVSTDIVVDAGT